MTSEPLPFREPDAAEPRGSVLANISRRMVALHKEFAGRGPTKARTYLNDDVVLVLMRGGYTRVEETLLAEGRRDVIIRQRHEFQEVMRDRFIEVIEDELGRGVMAFMSANSHDPDLLAELFVLGPEATSGR
jgi:uncharacterized protein YbcI